MKSVSTNSSISCLTVPPQEKGTFLISESSPALAALCAVMTPTLHAMMTNGLEIMKGFGNLATRE